MAGIVTGQCLGGPGYKPRWGRDFPDPFKLASRPTQPPIESVDSSWNMMAHGDAREGKWRGNWRMEWVASTSTLPRNMVYPALLPLMHTPLLPVVDWTKNPADLNGLVRFAEIRNLVPARVPSHFKWPLPRLFPGGKVAGAWLLPTPVYMRTTTRPSPLRACFACYGTTFTFKWLRKSDFSFHRYFEIHLCANFQHKNNEVLSV